MEAQSQKNSDSGAQSFAVLSLVQAVRYTVGILFKQIDQVNKAIAATMQCLMTVPSKRQLCQHQAAMDEKIAQVEDIKAEPNTAVTQCTFSESTLFEFRLSVTPLSGTHQYIHPQRQAAFQSPSVSGLRNTKSPSIWLGRKRSGTHSDGAAGGADSKQIGGGRADD